MAVHSEVMVRGIHEAVAGVAAAAATVALAVEIGWLWRAEAGRPAVILGCVAVGALALATPIALGAAARILGFAVLVVALPCALLVLTPERAAADVDRIAGRHALSTSIAVADALFDEAPVVVLLRTDSPQHAAAAGSLAAHLGGPTLLLPPGAVTPDLAAALGRLGTSHAVLVGTDVPSHVPRRLVDLGIETTVHEGTALEVAAAVVEHRRAEQWLVTDLEASVDGMSRNVAEAMRRGAPIVHAPDRLPLLSAAALLDGEAGRVVVEHGRLTPVARDVRSTLGAVAVASGFGADTVDRETVVVAGADRPLDAAVAGAAAAHVGADLRLIPPGGPVMAVHGEEIVVVGGSAAVSDDAVDRLAG